MQMCPFCDKVYDESEYSSCPYCSGELESDLNGAKFKDCPECGGSCIGMVVGNVLIVTTQSILMKMIMMAF